MDRRTFLKVAGATGGTLAGADLLAACDKPGRHVPGPRPKPKPPKPRHGRSILDSPANASPIEHVVVVMMENRSFDHWLGWLAGDEAWLEAGKKRYGKTFSVDGDQQQTFPSTTGDVDTALLTDFLRGGNPWRGCGHPDPGHGWDAGRAQRDGGFLAPGSGNDPFALGYYEGGDLPFTARLAKRFTVCDRSFASILGPTYPNREYLHSGTSGGNKTNYLPIAEGGFTWDTIWQRLAAAGVSHRYFYTDLPVTLLWGPRMNDLAGKVDEFFTRCAEGTLPQVSFVDPGFLTGSRTDNHPHGDVRAGEAFQRDVFAAFARSKHWEKGLFVLTYDEWGGFFDHVAPPTFPDERRSAVDAENFGQAGFRVPTVLASPYARPGSVDHTVYDHTSVLRFLEWQFLGAPPTGPGRDTDTWYLTQRDRHANNLGASLVDVATRHLGLDLDVAIAPASDDCDAAAAAAAGEGADASEGGEATGVSYQKHSFEEALDQGYFERVGFTPEPSLMAREWTSSS